MTDGDALLAAIAADPADDTVRLTYADWLDEQAHPVPWVSCPPCRGAGEVTYDMPAVSETRVCGACAGDGAVLGVHPLAARAEFIRVQITIARTAWVVGEGCQYGLPEHYVGPVDGHDAKLGHPCGRCNPISKPLVVREKQLLDAHRRDWLGGPKCGACGGKRTRTTRWRIAEMNADDYGESTSTCDACRGTGYECWPLVEMTHGRFGSITGSVQNITSHFTRGFVSRAQLRADQFTDEVAKLIFTHHPTVTEVLLTDRAPLLSGSDATGGPDWAWVIRMGDDRPGDDRLRPDDGQQFIRRPIWEKLDGHIKTPSARTLARRYASRDDAHAALLRAATDWGRELAGLPPLATR